MFKAWTDKRWRILILAALIVFVTLTNMMFFDGSALRALLSNGNPFMEPVYSGVAFLSFLRGWPTVLLVQPVYIAIMWGGFVLPSRRPHRRRGALIVLSCAIVVTLIGFRFGLSAGQASANLFFGSIVPILTYAGGVAYLYLSRHEPEFQPRLDAAVPVPEPAELHPIVTAKIADGDNWRDDLLSSLSQTGQEQPPRPNIVAGVLGLVCLVLVLLVFQLINQVAFAVAGPQLWISYLSVLIGAAVLSLPMAMFRRRWQLQQIKSFDTSLKKSDKRPIFYLRSFGLDELIGAPSVLEILFNIPIANREQAMVAQLRPCGPVIAIGRPGEKVPSLGASRFYVAHNLWQEKVADVSKVARLVVWASGTTPGLQWEITHLVRSLPPERLILWAHPWLLDLDPDEREAEWAAFVDGLGQLFPKPLPKPLGKTQVFAFDADFSAIPYKGVWGHTAFNQALSAKQIPPYDPAGQAKRKSRNRLVMVVAAAILALLLLVGAIRFVGTLLPGEPSAQSWNAVSNALLNDELAQPGLPSDQGVAAQSDSQIGSNFDSSNKDLSGKWFGKTPFDATPGQQGALRRAAKDYEDIYYTAHRQSDIEDMVYVRGSALHDRIHSLGEAQERLNQLNDLREALGRAEQDWKTIADKTEGEQYPARIHALIVARQVLLESEANILRALITYNGQWTSASDGIHIYRDQPFWDQAVALWPARKAAADAVLGAEFTGLTGNNYTDYLSSATSSADTSSPASDDSQSSSSSDWYDSFLSSTVAPGGN